MLAGRMASIPSFAVDLLGFSRTHAYSAQAPSPHPVNPKTSSPFLSSVTSLPTPSTTRPTHVQDRVLGPGDAEDKASHEPLSAGSIEAADPHIAAPAEGPRDESLLEVVVRGPLRNLSPQHLAISPLSLSMQLSASRPTTLASADADSSSSPPSPARGAADVSREKSWETNSQDHLCCPPAESSPQPRGATMLRTILIILAIAILALVLWRMLA